MKLLNQAELPDQNIKLEICMVCCFDVNKHSKKNYQSLFLNII